MNWDDLRLFLAVARASSLSQAVATLGVNQSTVSRRLAAMEADLDTRLIERRADGPLLTAAGTELLATATNIEAEVAESLTASGFAIRSQIIWAKDRLVLSRGDYHWQHEPCWYAVRTKARGHSAGDRKQNTLWQIASRDQDAETVHGTQKPVECMRHPILNNSNAGQTVFEPFMGSGTTLIAAETTGRICYRVELDPAYVDVAIERWQSFTGEDAVLVETGESFAALKAWRRAA